MTARRDGDTLPPTSTRDVILSAADTVFREIGYQSATVADIQREAGIAKATFYFYFANKDEVFVLVADAINAELHAKLAALRFLPGQGQFERVVAANAIYIKTMIRERRIFGDYLALSLITPRFRAAYSTNTYVFQTRMERHISRLSDEKVLSVVNVRLTAVSLIGMVQMLLFRYFNEPDIVGTSHIDVATVLRSASQIWYRALYGQPEPVDFDYTPYMDDFLGVFAAEPPLTDVVTC